MMTPDQGLVLGILAVSLFLFIIEKPRVDVVALLVLIACVVTRLVTPSEAFTSFSNPAVITVWAVFIVSGALFKTGVADKIGDLMLHFAGNSQTRLMIVMMLTAGIMSAFMNNIGAVAILLPAVVSMSRKLSLSPSKMLIPLAVSSLLGGNITLIGTPPNLLASAEMARYGMVPFGFFDYTPTGVVVLAVGIIYMLVAGRHILPERTSGDDIVEGYDIQDVLTEVRVTAESPLLWRKIRTIRFGGDLDIAIVYVRRIDEYLQQASDRRLREDDILLLEGSEQDIQTISNKFRLQIQPTLAENSAEDELAAAGQLVEITISPRSKFRGRTLRELAFRSRYGVTVLAIRHEGEAIVENVVDQSLRFGDVMLAQGAERRIKNLRRNPNLLILDQRPEDERRTEKSRRALTILVMTLVTLAFVTIIGNQPNNLLHIAQSEVGYWVSLVMLTGAMGMVLTQCLSMEEAYQSIDWKSVFLIAGMLPLGVAMASTNTDVLIADKLLSMLQTDNPTAILIGLYILATILTSVISNAAATVLIVPIAIQAAFQLGVRPEPFVMTAVIGASSAFLLPIGHQANIIVYGAGGYKFFDFFKVGIWLNILLLFVVALLVPMLWSF